MSNRSPRYPRIPLSDAIPLAEQLFDREGRSAVKEEVAVVQIGYKGLNGTSSKVLSALKKYGLIEDANGGVKVSQDAIAIAAHRHDPANRDRLEAIRRCANRLELFKTITKDIGPSASEQELTAQLVMRGFSQSGAKKAARAYRATMRLVDGTGNGYPGQAVRQGKASLPGANGSNPVKVGDYVQWASGGQEQFNPPRRVTWISEDESHLRVHGSMTGIPMAEATVVDPPAPTPLSALRQGDQPAVETGGTPPDISVLQVGNRLQITADVDAAGLAKLKQVLEQYEAILKLLQ
jgi:hypothetical protein